MWNRLKRYRRQPEGREVRLDDPARRVYETPWVRDVNRLLEPIDLNWEAEPDRESDWTRWKQWFDERERRFSLMVDRNLLGKELEKSGEVSTAMALYEANARDGFDGNGPYDRLAVMYRRDGRLDDEIRILNRAIEVFSAYRGPRTDIQPKLEAFHKRLQRVLSLKAKE